jgi:hypothetical protein
VIETSTETKPERRSVGPLVLILLIPPPTLSLSLQVGDTWFTLEQIYGLEANGDSADDEGPECVVCLANPRAFGLGMSLELASFGFFVCECVCVCVCVCLSVLFENKPHVFRVLGPSNCFARQIPFQARQRFTLAVTSSYVPNVRGFCVHKATNVQSVGLFVNDS